MSPTLKTAYGLELNFYPLYYQAIGMRAVCQNGVTGFVFYKFTGWGASLAMGIENSPLSSLESVTSQGFVELPSFQ